MELNYEETAEIFKAFCDVNRVKIIDLLIDGEKCACVLLEKLSISQSTLSHHMKILTTSKVVKGRNEGKWTYYSISEEGVNRAEKILQSFVKPEKSSEKCSCKI